MRPFATLLLFGAALAIGFAQSATNGTDLVIRFLEQRVTSDPDDFIAAGKLGHTYLQKARESGAIDCYAKAERLFRDVLKWTPDLYSLRASLGSALVSQHKFREAAALAGKLTAESPDEAAAYGVLGDALLEIGDIPGADAAYKKLIALNPGLSASVNVQQATETNA